MKYPVLYEIINSLSAIPTNEWTQLEDISQIAQVEKNTVILDEGEQAQHLFVIISGSLRMFYRDESGKQFNHAFMFEGMIAAGYSSLVSGTPSKFVIETMENTTLLKIPYTDFLPFYDRNPCWDKLARKALEMNYIDKLEREAILLVGDAMSKYERTLKLYPQLDNRIPQYHIASFIGITPSSLNKLLKGKR